jgi:phosphoribosyl 1,2-cyclic phosphodiesterase
MKELYCTILATGSDGNAILIHTKNSAILIDAGVTAKQLFTRLETEKINPGIIKAIILTHDHSDHIKGAKLISKKLSIPTYVTGEVYREFQGEGKFGKEVDIYEPNITFKIDEFNITAFKIPHDTPEPVGLDIEFKRQKVAIATDFGSLTERVKKILKHANTIVLESDYDKRLLLQSHRPEHLKRKIMGNFGHLSNQEVLDSFAEIITTKLNHIFLVHLSKECNSEQLLYSSALNKLIELHKLNLSLHIVSSKHCPYPTIKIN